MRLIRRHFIFLLLFYLAIVLVFLNRQRMAPSSSIVANVGNTSPTVATEASPLALPILGSDDMKLDWRETSDQIRSSHSIILIWSGSPGEIGQANLGGCPDYGCVVTHDRRLINQSTAVIFVHGAGADDAPKLRHSWQYYVFYSQESPVHVKIFQPYRQFFNLSLSYRRDSDAPSPYGYAVSRPKPFYGWRNNFEKLIAGKSQLVAWFVSNCNAPSNRDAYVKGLQKWIPVHVYGPCGTFVCPKTLSKLPRRPDSKWIYNETTEDEDFEEDKDDCDRVLEKNYKFYLAFENSICKDYATEKLWQKLTLQIVPIVLKRSIVAKHAPPGSFIAIDDFQSPRDLARYLKKLDADPRAYQLFYQWRVRYRPVFLNGLVHDVRERPWGFCALCFIISQNRSSQRRNPNEDVKEWWERGAQCDNDLVKRLMSKKRVRKITP